MFKGTRKKDLLNLIYEIGESVDETETIDQLKTKIESSKKFKEDKDEVIELLSSIVEERKIEALKEAQKLEIEKIKLIQLEKELELVKLRSGSKSEINGAYQKTENIESLDSLIKSVKTLTVKIPSRPEGWGYFFASLERAFVSKSVPDKFKSEILLNLLGEKATNIITYIKDDELGNYSKVKSIVLKQYEPSPQICLDNFRKAQRMSNETYVQFASRLITSWEYYLKLKNVTEFETLNQLVISDKLCQTLDKDVMCFINVRQADSWFKPVELAKEIDLYYNSKGKPIVNNITFSNKNNYLRTSSKVFLTDVKNSKCILLCEENHPIYKCPVYKNMPVKERVDLVKSKHLCFNCLSNHKFGVCKNNKFSCGLCKNSKHHISLHYPREKINKPQISQTEMNHDIETTFSNLNATAPSFSPLPPAADQNLFSTACHLAKGLKTVLLSTFVCLFSDNEGKCYPVRGLLDVGANSNFISKSLADTLQLKRERTNISVTGINNVSLNINSRVNATILNRDKSFELSLNFLVVPKITEQTPSSPLEINVSSLENIKLADNKFFEPGPIEFLIGAEYFYELLKPGQISLPDYNLRLQNSVFGFIVSGSLSAKQENNIYCGLVTDNLELEKTLREFWEIENVERESEISKTKEAQICEEHFLRNYSRTEKGNYVVKMPFKEDPSCLGESRKNAEKCLNSLWNRLIKEPEYCELYINFMKEYLDMGHMEEVIEAKEPEVNYYIPHHCVFRPDSISTPLRVVFNASALTTSGNSLNSLQLNGGTIQDDLLNIMLRFRKHQFVFIADIRKMYRMILMNSNQRDLLRILFKEKFNDPVKVYKLCTVTYGTTSAPFLATRSVQQLVKDEGNQFPLASSVLLQDIYMDDILTGDDNIDTVRDIQQQLISLLSRGGMELHKWSANNSLLMHNRTTESEYSFSNDTKTLGILWKPFSDCFGFNLVINLSETYSKRTVLSQIAKIFDPFGLIGPIIIRAKVFLQKLWLLKLDWADALPHKENAEWKSFLNALKTVNLINVPRCVLTKQLKSVELHGFSDASEVAYGAVIYVKTINSYGDSQVKLLISKSRVAPLKSVTIPRLELCSAVLLVKLMQRVLRALKLDISKIHFWTDSTIVLSWLRKECSHLKTFVANRISVIQNLTVFEQWHHVSSNQNPADFISRGIDPAKLQSCELWWVGPPFLLQPVATECQDNISVETEELFLRELKIPVSSEICAFVTAVEPLKCISEYSSYTKSIRVVAWCKRFLHNARNPLHSTRGTLTTSELSCSLLCIVKNIQRTSFMTEIQSLEKGVSIPNNSKLLNLCPFLDEDGILRVGGRLINSNLNELQKHPMLLPTKHSFTVNVINYFHILYFHAGAETTLSLIRNKFWIISARNLIKKILFNCIICKKFNSRSSQQLMADLPAARVTISRPFSKIGLDYAGPFIIKNFAGRSKQKRKVFVCIFVCFATKALHLEIVNDLTSAAFLAALKRFIARRGKPSDVFSDNGTNFIGANRELRVILKSLFKDKNEDEVKNYLATEGINWHFNPPATPHFGGLWEASVKSLKYHLRRVVGKTILSYEEMLTLIIQIEAVLNSRPLCPISNDPNDVETLTPAHFLVGSSLVALPEPNFTEVPINLLNRWQLVQKLTQHFWKKWSSEYLNKLLSRPKWYKGRVELKVGDLVLVRESDNYSPFKWHLARIINIHPGKDNIVRVVTLKDKGGTYKRPMTKVVPLPFVNDNLSVT